MTAAVKSSLIPTTIASVGTCQIELDTSLLAVVQRTVPSLPVDISTTITAYASSLNIDSVIDLFTRVIDPKEIANDETHVGCEECEHENTRPVAPGLKLIPATRAREAVCLVDLHFTIKKTDEACDIYAMLPGIDILEREPLVTPIQVVCYDIIFFHELWYTDKVGMVFQDHSTVAVLDFLVTLKRYKVSQRPERGNIVVFSHGNLAVHYAVIESVDADGNFTLISKFGEYHVFRHRLDRLLRPFGIHYAVLERPNPFPALYTSPAKIRSLKTGGGCTVS